MFNIGIITASDNGARGERDQQPLGAGRGPAKSGGLEVQLRHPALKIVDHAHGFGTSLRFWRCTRPQAQMPPLWRDRPSARYGASMTLTRRTLALALAAAPLAGPALAQTAPPAG